MSDDYLIPKHTSLSHNHLYEEIHGEEGGYSYLQDEVSVRYGEPKNNWRAQRSLPNVVVKQESAPMIPLSDIPRRPSRRFLWKYPLIFLCVSLITILFLWIFVFNHGFCLINQESTVDSKNPKVYYSCQVIWWRWNQCDWQDTVFNETERKCIADYSQSTTVRQYFPTPISGVDCKEGKTNKGSRPHLFSKCVDGKWKEMTCAMNQVYIEDPMTNFCVPKDQAPTTPEPECIPDHIKSGSGNRYEVCENDAYIWKICPPDTMYSDDDRDCKTILCVFEKKEPVRDSKNRRFKQCVEDGFKWDFKQCPDGFVFVEKKSECEKKLCDDGEMRKYDNDVHQYFKCVAPGAEWKLKRCPNGQKFHNSRCKSFQ